MNGYLDTAGIERLGLKSVGENVLISEKACIYMPEKISIGSNVRIDDFCILVGDITLGNYIHISPFASIHGTGGGSVTMKDFTGLGSYATIYAGSDDFNGGTLTNPTVPKEYCKIISGNVVMEKHCLVGIKSVLLPKAYMNEGSVLGAMSLLNKKTKPWSVYFGSPARRIDERNRKTLECEELFLKSKMSKMGVKIENSNSTT